MTWEWIQDRTVELLERLERIANAQERIADELDRVATALEEDDDDGRGREPDRA